MFQICLEHARKGEGHREGRQGTGKLEGRLHEGKTGITTRIIAPFFLGGRMYGSVQLLSAQYGGRTVINDICWPMKSMRGGDITG